MDPFVVALSHAFVVEDEVPVGIGDVLRRIDIPAAGAGGGDAISGSAAGKEEEERESGGDEARSSGGGMEAIALLHIRRYCPAAGEERWRRRRNEPEDQEGRLRDILAETTAISR